MLWCFAPRGYSRPARRSAFDRFYQRRAEPCRRWRNLDAGGFHRRDLVFGAALAAGDDGTGMAHGAAGRRGTPGDEAGHRLAPAALGLVDDELGCIFFRRTADFA